MEHYVTLFDSLFLPQGLALHASMERYAGSYTLWILCVDDDAYEVLRKLELPNIRLLQLSKIETDDLKRIKGDRTQAEYCWTLTPFAPRFVFEAEPEVSRVTYLDADIWFRKNPLPIFREFDSSGKFVLITDHAYAPEYDQTESSGQYCVQYMTFSRWGGEPVRKWWEERCIEWCHARLEGGKFGDQKYLDDWPMRFADTVHVLANKELALAPWNAIRFPYGGAVFYHFHGLRIVSQKEVNIGSYKLPQVVIENVYKPYLTDLEAAYETLAKLGVKLRQQASPIGFAKRSYSRFKSLCQHGDWGMVKVAMKW